MKLNIYVKQQHTETGETRELKIDEQHRSEVWRYSNLHVDGKTYQVQEMRNTATPQELDVICFELPTAGAGL